MGDTWVLKLACCAWTENQTCGIVIQDVKELNKGASLDEEGNEDRASIYQTDKGEPLELVYVVH